MSGGHGRLKVVPWGGGFALLEEDDEGGDAIDVERTDSLSEPRLARVLAVCTTVDAAEAALRLCSMEKS